MSIKVTKDSINVREMLNELSVTKQYSQQQFWFVGDGSVTAFSLPNGWLPLNVFANGLLQKEGVGDEYTSSGGTVTFAVAPAGDVCIVGVM